MTARKEHPADAAARADIERAYGFIASVFIGTGKWAKSDICPTLAEARKWAARLEARLGGFRKALIYALVADPARPESPPREIHVPANYHQPTLDEKELTMSVKTYTKTQNAARAAKKALGGFAQRGVDFELYEHKTGHWAWRAKGAAEAAVIESVTGTTPPARVIKTTPIQGTPGKTPKENSPKPKREPKPKKLSKRAEAEARAKTGVLVPPPNFSAETHKRYRGKLAELVTLVDKGDIKGLKEYPINPVSSSPKALDRYRNLAVTALEARAAGAREEA